MEHHKAAKMRFSDNMCKRRELDTQFDSHDVFDELHYDSKRETGRTKQLETNKKLQVDFSTFAK